MPWRHQILLCATCHGRERPHGSAGSAACARGGHGRRAGHRGIPGSRPKGWAGCPPPGARGQDGARGSLSAGRCRSDPVHEEHGAAAGATGPVTAEDRVRTRRPDKGPSAAGAASGDSWGGDTGARGSQGRAPRRSRPREGSPRGEAEGGRQHRGHDPRLAFGCPGARPLVWSSLRASRLPPGTTPGTAPAPGPRPRGSEQPRAGAPGREQLRSPGWARARPPQDARSSRPPCRGRDGGRGSHRGVTGRGLRSCGEMLPAGARTPVALVAPAHHGHRVSGTPAPGSHLLRHRTRGHPSRPTRVSGSGPITERTWSRGRVPKGGARRRRCPRSLRAAAPGLRPRGGGQGVAGPQRPDREVGQVRAGGEFALLPRP